LNSVFSDRRYSVDLVPADSKCLDERIVDCLRRSWRSNPEAHTLILTDRVLTAHKGKHVLDSISTCISVGDFDLAYLFKHGDKCQMHEPVSSAGQTSIVSCYSPFGLEAILYSPSGRDIILGKKNMRDGRKFKLKKGLERTLNERIYDGAIKAIGVSPNLFEYDTVNNTTDVSHYSYRNECAPLQLDPRTSERSSWSIIHLVFAFLIILVVAWALLQLAKK
jgi:hypothetical protein